MAALTDGKVTINSSPVIPPTTPPPVTPAGFNPVSANPSTAKIPTPAAQPVTQPTVSTPTPPAYNTQTGLLTDYGRSLGLKEVNKPPATAPTSPTTPTSTGTGTNPPVDQNQTDLSQEQTDYKTGVQTALDAAKTFSDTITSIQNGSTPLSAGDQAQIAALQQSYNDAIGLQQLQNVNSTGVANIRGYQTGSAEYDPSFQAKTIGAIAQAGAQKVLALQVAEAGAVAKLTQDIKDRNIAQVKESYDALTAAQDKKQTALQTMIKDTQDAIQKANDAKQKVIDSVNTVAQKAAENGASADKVNAITASSSTSAAIAAAGDWLQSATGQLGDYLQYKRSAEQNGLVPEDYATWKAADDAKASKLKVSEAYGTAFATAKGKAAGEAAVTPANGGLLPVTSNNGITYNVPAAVAPYVKISESGVKYIDASGLSAAEKGKVIKDAFNGGVNPIPVITDPSAANDVNNITDATLKLKDMRDAFTANTAESAAQRDLYFAAAQKIATELQTNPNVVGLDIYQDAALDILKAMSGTKGFRGGTSMVDQVKVSFPKATDTQDVVNTKIDNMQKLINDRQTGLIGSPSAGDKLLIDQKTNEANLSSNLAAVKTTNPTLYNTASTMYLSVNPDTGQPYTAADILQAFPELNK